MIIKSQESENDKIFVLNQREKETGDSEQYSKGLTSLAVTFKASHSILGRMFRKNVGLYSISERSSSASLK